MNKKTAIREILEKLINGKRRIENRYSRTDIDKAILEVRGVDKRTRDNWFFLLWNLHYLEQPEPNLYSLNLSKLSELEPLTPVPEEIPRGQKRLGAFLK